MITTHALVFPRPEALQTHPEALRPGIKVSNLFPGHEPHLTSYLPGLGLTAPPEPRPDSRHGGWREVILSCP